MRPTAAIAVPTSLLTPLLATTILAFALTGPVLAAGTDATGTMVYKGKTTTLKYAYFVRGPDGMAKDPIKRLILSANDLGAGIAACKKMSCTDSDLKEGVEINLDGGSRLMYWLVQNDQRVQYSGTAPVAALATKVNDGKRLTGTLKLDQAAAGGAVINVEFDAALVKELTAP
jgi:hypothetical protein